MARLASNVVTDARSKPSLYGLARVCIAIKKQIVQFGKWLHVLCSSALIYYTMNSILDKAQKNFCGLVKDTYYIPMHPYLSTLRSDMFLPCLGAGMYLGSPNEIYIKRKKEPSI